MLLKQTENQRPIVLQLACKAIKNFSSTLKPVLQFLFLTILILKQPNSLINPVTNKGLKLYLLVESSQILFYSWKIESFMKLRNLIWGIFPPTLKSGIRSSCLANLRRQHHEGSLIYPLLWKDKALLSLSVAWPQEELRFEF